MVRRPFFVAVAAVTAMFAAACGNVASSSSSGGETPPGITDDQITIGATLPLTGTAAVSGQGLQAGMKIAVDELNAAGGIGGRKINLVILDDGFTADRVVTNVRRLVSQDKVYAVVAPAGSQGLPGTWQFIAQNGTPVWGPISPADPKQREVFLLSASRATQGRVAIDYFAKQGITKIAVIKQDNDLGVSMKQALDLQLPKHPEMQLVADETQPVGSTEVSVAVNNVLAKQPEAVLLATDNTSVALILKALRAQGFTGPIYADQGGGGTGGPSTVGPAGDAAEGFIAGMQADVVSTDNPAVEHWRELAKKYDGEQGESGFSLQTYSFVMAFAELVKRLGDDLSYDNFVKTAENLRNDPIKLGTIPDIECGPLPDGHDCVISAGLAKYTGGKWVVEQQFTAPE
ncbi:amino acid/amide ABC transporter substrate-binding protein, HAAT family [Pseudonocardia thermophila]|jgi:ABC-type branched-chain amino acid transport systems, periplasmic component|uniref:Amino acid/amide ABC transporter substrate-binding protein, HAAT family n=1 Tax=Pseudonocardia thermophila TaxID=1848 RepID=A0A1M6T9D6_PSETH|nr:ABC transporter substrate-binding protein [Pseudonocardia thermophila]SHK53469.1 amino acid/amide ABC transporter substrate-binding protein, HAAT family [Pseudonocardia thermophila]